MQPDDDLAFERIYNTPRRGLGESALRTLRLIQRAQKVSLFEATRRALETDELKAPAAQVAGRPHHRASTAGAPCSTA